MDSSILMLGKEAEKALHWPFSTHTVAITGPSLCTLHFHKHDLWKHSMPFRYNQRSRCLTGPWFFESPNELISVTVLRHHLGDAKFLFPPPMAVKPLLVESYMPTGSRFLILYTTEHLNCLKWHLNGQFLLHIVSSSVWSQAHDGAALLKLSLYGSHECLDLKLPTHPIFDWVLVQSQRQQKQWTAFQSSTTRAELSGIQPNAAVFLLRL